MDGFMSVDKRSYDDFKKQVPDVVLPLVETIREYCMSLSDNVVEDIRMHRIVFGKSMTFRWFLDIRPEPDKIVAKIQKSRKVAPEIFEIKNKQEASDLMQRIKHAFDEIR